MNKKNMFFITVFIVTLMLGWFYYKNTKDTFKIDKSRIAAILYVHKIDKNRLESFSLFNHMNKNDIDSIVTSLNNGKLKPNKKEIGERTLEYIEVCILHDRWFSIYKQKKW